MGRLNYRYEKKDKAAVASSTAPALLFERRVLAFVSSSLFLGLASWLTAVATDYWVVVVAGYNGTLLQDTQRVYLWSHSGLWRRCDISAHVESKDNHQVECKYHSFSGGQAGDNLVRVELAFVVMVSIVMLLGLCFSFYSLSHPRYTFKRVSGGLHFLTSVMLIVLIRGLIESEGHMSQHHDEFEGHKLKSLRHYYGYSYLMAWITFTITSLASLAFFVTSKKRKHLAHDIETQLR